ncbi:hypothetical protein ABIB62_003776 [Mucilaginibacter sp. UYP25]|uniref:hypothetical protein n=1 Tax=unclassified Mucilaginibacter TaxID=2617802 RepID=UPI00339599A0
MKRILLSMLLILSIATANAQTINYTQLQQLFKSWKNSKGKNLITIDSKLKIISPKWKLQSKTPKVDGYVKSIVWQALEGKSDTSLFIISIEEDEESYKYSISYLFHNKVWFNNLHKGIISSTYYKGNVVSFSDKTTGETTYTGKPEEVGPLSSRTDCILSDFSKNEGVFTFDLKSRYINK